MIHLLDILPIVERRIPDTSRVLPEPVFPDTLSPDTAHAIASSNLLGGFYEQTKARLHIRSESRGWRLFAILRTFALINLSWYFDCTASLREALRMIRLSLTQFAPAQFLSIPAGGAGTGYTPWALLTLGLGVLLCFVVELLQENGKLGREPERMHWLAQTALILALIVSVPLLGPTSAARGFIYAQF